MPNQQLTPYQEKVMKELKTLAHSYQESFQPSDDKNFDYRWGDGFWEGLKYSESFILSALQGQTKIYLEEIEKLKVKCHVPGKGCRGCQQKNSPINVCQEVLKNI